MPRTAAFVPLLLLTLVPLPGSRACADDLDGTGGEASKPEEGLATGHRSGAVLELLAVTRTDEKKPRAWKPDGTVVEWSSKWPKILRVRGPKPTHGFIFRVQGLPASHTLGWQLKGAWATPTLDGVIPEMVSVSSRLPDKRTTDIQVGLLAKRGPWQRVDADGSIKARVSVAGYAKRIYELVQSVDVLGKKRPVVVLRGFADEKAADAGEAEIVAVDSNGRRYDRRGVAPVGNGQAPYFLVQRYGNEIDHFEYRIRPYLGWVAFEKISLKPGNQTEFQVTVTESQWLRNASK